MSNSFTYPPYLRPTKIEWLFDMSGDNWIEKITSKSTQKIATSLAEIIDKSGLEIAVNQATQQSFSEWFEYYQHTMTEQGKDVLATPEWFLTKTAESLEVFIIEFHQDSRLVGSSVFSKSSAGKFTEHFKASDRIDISNMKNASLGTVIDLYFITTARDMGATAISSGTSRNGFGFYNTLGYLAFKIKLGYKPVISEIATLETTFEHDPEVACIWFITQNNTNLEVLIYLKDNIDQEIHNLVTGLALKVNQV